ncbi:protein of unknown function [Pseudodesulfovibrio profundus]|uniref:Uncharacterized protein n=1 Tax=Pseudodesulfovibrio profundus TaxID=57320 RepID=A0A2C8FCH4_9BACT|nr:protein of unknown function [Pseudodesulfovibrio profundus]
MSYLRHHFMKSLMLFINFRDVQNKFFVTHVSFTPKFIVSPPEHYIAIHDLYRQISGTCHAKR